PTIASIRKGTLASIYRKDNAPLKPEPADITEPQPPYVGYERGDHYDVTFDAHESDEDMMDLDEDQPARASAPVRPVCVTPTVERIARQVFSTPLNRVGAPLPDVTWRHSRAQGTQVAVDAKLKRGQCIMVPTGIGKADAQQDWAFNNERTTSANAVANNYRFARIISIASGGKRLHVRWFDHSAKSDLLKEFERPMELFLTNRCAWLAREHVERLVDVEFLSEDEEPPHREKGYYVRFIRDHHSGAFIRVQSSDYDLGQSKNSCLVCDQAQLQESRFEEDCEELRLGGVTLHKGEFVAIHPYRRAPWLTSDRDSADPSAVVQIRHIYRRVNNGRREPQALYLRGFERVELLRKRRLVDQVHLPCKGRPVQDERRLCSMDAAEWELTLDFESAKKAPVRKCFVRHPESFSSTDEMNEWLDSSALHYIVNLRGVHAGATAGDESRPPRVKGVAPLPLNDFNSISACTRCKDDSLSPVPKMRMLDLFGGVGGLSKGLVQAGICELKYMVDHNSSACAAYSTNFPKAKSIHGDVNVVLSRTILAAEGRDKYLAALNDQDRSSLLPKQGEIDFICGGPPCQSFSGANRFKRDDDPRTAMVAAVMSAVEHYHPKYFLIENVPNALTHKITGPVPRAGSADSEESVDPPPNLIEQGILRFLMRVTLDLGYSFRFGVLEASQYGAPQRRRRAFILGARSNMTLPEFPLATHRVSKPETGIKLPTGGYLDALKDKSGFALHPAVTVWDAISDLKPFDWVNPHILVPQTQNTRNEERDRLLNGIPAFVAVRGERREIGLGADDQAIVYRQDSPTTTYQMEARKNARWVTGHYTSSFVSEKFVERVVTIPLSANADHRSTLSFSFIAAFSALKRALALPEILRRGEFLSNVFGSGGASGYYRGAFGRYDRKGQFATILTSLRPAKKNGFCIHPEQKRMLTMRELARGQGFPDDFVFSGSVDEVNRQIGNAVAVQVSRAIGKEIKKAMIKDGLI
ncbi:hypothetical protein FRC09_006344, partial [Ceratobasidium sp. 395]